MRLSVFVLYHDQRVLDAIPRQDFLVPVNLSTLDIGRFQDNLLGESRAFLSDISDVEDDYIGFVNARWDQKYFQLHTRLATLGHEVERLAAPGWILCPFRATNWVANTQLYHPSMMPLLEELSGTAGLPLNNDKESVWCNDFICHRSVFFDWRRFWRQMFGHFDGKYGLKLPFNPADADPSRYPAFF